MPDLDHASVIRTARSRASSGLLCGLTTLRHALDSGCGIQPCWEHLRSVMYTSGTHETRWNRQQDLTMCCGLDQSGSAITSSARYVQYRCHYRRPLVRGPLRLRPLRNRPAAFTSICHTCSPCPSPIVQTAPGGPGSPFSASRYRFRWASTRMRSDVAGKSRSGRDLHLPCFVCPSPPIVSLSITGHSALPDTPYSTHPSSSRSSSGFTVKVSAKPTWARRRASRIVFIFAAHCSITIGGRTAALAVRYQSIGRV